MDASLYEKTNNVTKEGTEMFLNKLKHLLHWQNDETILDVGCGDAAVTLEVLLPNLPKNFRSLVGTDVSEKMIELAKRKCHHPNIYFTISDIASPTIPQQFFENFNHIFSFYCLHWVKDQRRALKNIFGMLKPGGESFISLVASTPIYSAHEVLTKSKQWACYMTDVDDFVPLYHHSRDPVMDLKNLLEAEGFVCHACEVEHMAAVFPDSLTFSKFMCSLNPFMKRIPEPMRAAFAESFVAETIKNNGGDDTIYKYVALNALVSKPT